MALNATLAMMTLLALVTVVMSSSGNGAFCYPGDDCWPSLHEESMWYETIQGRVLNQVMEDYRNYTIMINTRVTKFPYAIVLAETVDDVIKTVNFANRFNIKLSVRSSGHDYIGRSTGDGTLQINLFHMKGLKFNLNSSRNAAGELSAQSGNSWIEVYEETNKIGRVIVGGFCHTVSMGGYTLGGGHSPIGRKFGLAVDNLLEVEMVTANGSLVYADEQSTRFVNPDTGATISTSTNTDIFWAVRGGGGGTFGIVTTFTYKLHFDSKMVVITCYAPKRDDKGNEVGRAMMESFNNLLSTTLAPEWGGYEVMFQTVDPNDGPRGGILLSLNHFGEWGSDSFNTIGPFYPMMQNYCYSYTNVSSFLEYEKGVNDPPYTSSYIFNTLMQPDSFTDSFYDFIVDHFAGNYSADYVLACTGVLIGGNMKNTKPDATAVNPSLRTGVMALSCVVSPGKNSGVDPFPWVTVGEHLTDQLIQFGKGTYFNEPSAHLPNWKTDYWGGHYDRLLAIKREWDPQNVFTCLHCVGSDLNVHGTPSGSGHAHPIIVG